MPACPGVGRYRHGEFQLAIKSLQKSNALDWDPIAKSQNWLVLAMAHHRLGHADEARQCLETARKLIDEAKPKKPDAPVDIDPADWIPIQVLLRKRKVCLANQIPKAEQNWRTKVIRK